MAFWHWRRGKVLATAPSAVCAVEDREPEATEFSMERALDEAIRQLTKGKNFVVLANVGNLRTEEVINCHPAQQPRIASGARILSKYMSALAVKFQEAGATLVFESHMYVNILTNSDTFPGGFVIPALQIPPLIAGFFRPEEAKKSGGYHLIKFDPFSTGREDT